MLTWVVIFLVIAIIAALFGFTGVAKAATGIAKVIFFIFLILFIIFLILYFVHGGTVVTTMPAAPPAATSVQ